MFPRLPVTIVPPVTVYVVAGSRPGLGPVQLVGAVIALGGAPFDFPHDDFVDVTDHELRHVRLVPPDAGQC